MSKKDLNKPNRYLLLIQEISKATLLTISEKKLKDILGNPSRAQFHKDVTELTTDVGPRKAILLKKVDEDGNITYQLNETAWVQYLEAGAEIEFILKTYKELGALFPKIDVDGLPLPKSLDRKFFNLPQSKMKIKPSHEMTLDKIIKALVGTKQLLIRYESTKVGDEKIKEEKKSVEILPLTIVNHREDLYLCAYKGSISPSNFRSYKISRILEIHETKNTFKYPSQSVWDPAQYFTSSSIVVGEQQSTSIRVFSDSRRILSSKIFFNCELRNVTNDYDEYELSYTNREELLGFLAVYGRDIEIIGNADLKKAFISNAKKLLDRNSK